jgi:hypothetical protein
MTQLSWAVAGLMGPLLAGILIEIIRLQGIIMIDLLSFLAAFVTLLFVRFPSVIIPENRQETKRSLFQETKNSWNYILQRSGLIELLLFRASYDFSVEVISVLIVPLILSFTSPSILGLILFSGGLGMVIGSLIMSTWGGGEKLVRNIVMFRFLGGFCIFVAGFYPAPFFLACLAFLYYIGLPISGGCDQLIWYQKIPQDLQGRVFALRQMIVTLFLPVAYLGAGLLADHVFEPLLHKNGLLASSIGRIIGIGQGRGIGLMFIGMGFITMLIAIIAYTNSRLRVIDNELPNAMN